RLSRPDGPVHRRGTEAPRSPPPDAILPGGTRFAVHEGCLRLERVAWCGCSCPKRVQFAPIRCAVHAGIVAHGTELAMTDSSPPSIRQAEAPAKKGGFRLRVFFLIAAPVVLLGIAGAYLLYVAPRAQGAVSPTDFLLAFAGAVALSLLVAVLFAYLADLALRRRLASIENALREGDRNADSLAAGGARSWQGLRRLASAAQDAVSRTEDRAQDAEELKALQRAADELLEQIRGWAETEIAPSFESTGPLAELSGALQTLVRHLEERLGEAREVTELARRSVSEACESMERASRESGRSAREIAALLTAASEVKRLGAELTARLREPTALAAVEPEGAAAKPPVEIVAWRERVHTLGGPLESPEPPGARPPPQPPAPA